MCARSQAREIGRTHRGGRQPRFVVYRPVNLYRNNEERQFSGIRYSARAGDSTATDVPSRRPVLDGGLRDFYASALIRAGESVKTVQAAIGYASAVETLETYAALWPHSEARIRAAVDDLGLRSEARTSPEQSGVVQSDGPQTAQ